MIIMSQHDYIKFDVGQRLFICHRSTINKYPDSKLAELILPSNDTRDSPEDYLVIDYPTKYFNEILNFMRDPTALELDKWKLDDLNGLMGEAQYYRLAKLVEICNIALEMTRDVDFDLKSQQRPLVVKGFLLVDGNQILNYLAFLDLIDPGCLDVCCFLGHFPGAEDSKYIIFNPIKKEIIIATDEASRRPAMIWITQKFSRLGPEHYDRIPEFFSMATDAKASETKPI